MSWLASCAHKACVELSYLSGIDEVLVLCVVNTSSDVSFFRLVWILLNEFRSLTFSSTVSRYRLVGADGTGHDAQSFQVVLQVHPPIIWTWCLGWCSWEPYENAIIMSVCYRLFGTQQIRFDSFRGTFTVLKSLGLNSQSSHWYLKSQLQ